MKIRKSKNDDLKNIMKLVNQAQAYFKSQGIDQWQDGYPNEEAILQDISLQQSYVLEDQEIAGTMFFTFEPDPNYLHIDGKWLSEHQSYGVIHRIVVDENQKGSGLAKQLLDYCIDQCHQNHIHSIRIDTHLDNLSMQKFLKKNGFILCGNITLQSGAPRIALEKIIE